MRKLTIAASVFIAALVSGCVKEMNPDANTQIDGSSLTGKNNVSEFIANDKDVPNELLVKFKRGISPTARENALARIAGKVREQVLTDAMRRMGETEGFFVVHTPNAALDAVGRMKGLPEVELAEPNQIYRHIPLDEANDPIYNNPNENIWGMMGDLTTPLSAKLGSQAGEAWAGIDLTGAQNLIKQTGSSNVYVGIIDEGVQFNHEEFQGTANRVSYNNIFVNPKEGTTRNRRDDDNNGYVDDFYGWDFAGRDNTIYDGSSDDHGTHVAGTIGAKGNNGKGVAGVVWDVKMITAKFLGINGGTTANAIRAIDYITDLKSRHNLNIVAINNSWGGGSYSELLKEAIARASLENILFIVAAGNNGANNDVTPSYPASYSFEGYTYNGQSVADNLISVGSLWLDETKAVSTFSNYGAKSVDVFAPGQRIWSTTPGNTYSNYSGTSMATPHVTGGVALWVAANDKNNDRLLDKDIRIGDQNFGAGTAYTAQMIKQSILYSAITHAQFAGKCLTGGYLDVHSAWQGIRNNSGTY